jgi:hypothetical protein
VFTFLLLGQVMAKPQKNFGQSFPQIFTLHLAKIYTWNGPRAPEDTYLLGTLKTYLCTYVGTYVHIYICGPFKKTYFLTSFSFNHHNDNSLHCVVKNRESKLPGGDSNPRSSTLVTEETTTLQIFSLTLVLLVGAVRLCIQSTTLGLEHHHRLANPIN